MLSIDTSTTTKKHYTSSCMLPDIRDENQSKPAGVRTRGERGLVDVVRRGGGGGAPLERHVAEQVHGPVYEGLPGASSELHVYGSGEKLQYRAGKAASSQVNGSMWIWRGTVSTKHASAVKV